jgi:DNA repair exonuclease SbcCD ATPase subunit
VGVHGGLPPGEAMTEDGTIIPADFEPAVKKLTAEEYEDQIKVLYEAFTSAQSDLEDAVATIEVLEKEIIEREIEKETQEALLSEKEVRVRELELRAVKASKKVEHLEPELEKMEEKYTREKNRVSTVFSIAEELDNDLKHAVVEMKARDDWYVDHMQIFEDLNKAIKVRYEMIERAIEAERKSQHMARAFTERMEDMVEARASDLADAEAEGKAAEDSTASVEVVDAASEEVEEVEEAATEEATEEVAEPAAPETTAAATWADGDDPWAE